MKNRRIFLGVAILLLGLGIVSVSLSGSLKETLSKRTNSPATSVASSSNKSSQEMPARAETAPTHFLADPLNLEGLTNNADLIIIGRVNSISNAGRATATLGIDKVVKGEADGRTVDFEFFPNRPSFVRIQPEVFGMFFLKWNEAGGGYRVLDPTYPAVIAPANAVLSKEGGMERTVNVVGQVLLTSRAAEDRRVAVSVLRGALTDRATELLRQATKDRDSVVRMQSISALLNRNDIETLAIAERTLLNPPAGTEPYLLDNISAALEGIKDPRAIPALRSRAKILKVDELLEEPLVDDTTPNIAAIVRERLLSRPGAERVVMGSRMFDVARIIALASFPPGLSEIETKGRLCERLYGKDVNVEAYIEHLVSKTHSTPNK